MLGLLSVGSTKVVQVTINNVGDVFSGFLFISTHNSLDLISLGSAEAYIG